MEAFVKYSLKEKVSPHEIGDWCEKHPMICKSNKNVIFEMILRKQGYKTKNFNGDFAKIYKHLRDLGILYPDTTILSDYPPELKRFLEFNGGVAASSPFSFLSFTDKNNSLSPTVKIGGKKKSVKK